MDDLASEDPSFGKEIYIWLIYIVLIISSSIKDIRINQKYRDPKKVLQKRNFQKRNIFELPKS